MEVPWKYQHIGRKKTQCRNRGSHGQKKERNEESIVQKPGRESFKKVSGIKHKIGQLSLRPKYLI